jgi:hypothetical protein
MKHNRPEKVDAHHCFELHFAQHKQKACLDCLYERRKSLYVFAENDKAKLKPCKNQKSKYETKRCEARRANAESPEQCTYASVELKNFEEFK